MTRISGDELEKLLAEAKEKEAKFLAATLEQQRVALAEDVIKYLGSAQIEACPGLYFAADVLPSGVDARVAILENPGMRCSVCALGSLFYAKVLAANGVRTEAWGFVRFDRRSLEAIFEKSQLDLIESAFEQDAMNNYSTDEVECEAASRTYEDVNRAEERMRLIMQNIVDNGGTFVVPESLIDAVRKEMEES